MRSPRARPTPFLQRTSTLIVLVFLLLLAEVPAQEPGLYRSNEEFLPIEPIREGERGEYTFVMRVSTSAGTSELELFREGELYRVRTETEGVGGLPQEITTTDAEGNLIEARWYRYDRRRRLRAVEVVRTREESRFLSGGAAGDLGNSEEVLEERTESGSTRAVYRYDNAGRMIARRRYRDGELVEHGSQEYSQGVLSLRTEVYPQERRRVVISYNERGLPEEEERYEAERLTSRVRKEYDEEGRLIREVVAARESREFRYVYDENGELLQEDELVNGALYRRIRYEENDRRVEVRFRAGEPFLRIYFRSDRRVREEVLRNGRIMEVRRFDQEEPGEQ